jgi:hypothetical protein
MSEFFLGMSGASRGYKYSYSLCRSGRESDKRPGPGSVMVSKQIRTIEALGPRSGPRFKKDQDGRYHASQAAARSPTESVTIPDPALIRAAAPAWHSSIYRDIVLLHQSQHYSIPAAL